MRRFAIALVSAVITFLFAESLLSQTSSTTTVQLETRVAKLEKRLASVEAQLARISKGGGGSAIVIDAFDKIPDEFGMGAGCSYAKTRNGRPVFVDSSVSGDAAMMINGKVVELQFLEQRQSSDGVMNIYKSNDFEVSMTTTKSTKTGHESMSEEGHVTVKAKDGTVVKQVVYGACGA